MKQTNFQAKGGRPPKVDTAKNCVMVRFTDEEYARFLDLYEKSGLHAKATFIKARVFDEKFHVITTDKSMLDFLSKLGNFYMQFRRIGVNYNQVVKILQLHFSEKKALALLYKLELLTKDLVVLAEHIRRLTEKLTAKQGWSC